MEYDLLPGFGGSSLGYYGYANKKGPGQPVVDLKSWTLVPAKRRTWRIYPTKKAQ